MKNKTLHYVTIIIFSAIIMVNLWFKGYGNVMAALISSVIGGVLGVVIDMIKKKYKPEKKIIWNYSL